MKKLLTLSVMILGTMGALNALTVVTTEIDNNQITKQTIMVDGEKATKEQAKSILNILHGDEGKKKTATMWGMNLGAGFSF